MIQHTFTNHDAVLPAYFPRLLFKLLTEQGVAGALLLKDTQLSVEALEDENFRMSFEQHGAFIRQALEVSGNVHLGIEFGQSITMTSLGILGYAALSCPNVSTCLETIVRYFIIRAPLIQLSFIEHNLTIEAHVEPMALQIDEALDFHDLRYFMLASAMCGTEHLLAYFTQKSHVIEHVDLVCEKPKDWEKIKSTLNFSVAFEQPYSRLYFPSGLLSTRLNMADAQTQLSAKLMCEQVMQRMGIQDGIVNRVRQYLLMQQVNFPNLVEAANHFCVSERTFRRELNKAGTSYQKILDKVRENIASEHLLTSQKTVYEIALAVGFTDVSNFSRAFKKWTGKSPSQFKQVTK